MGSINQTQGPVEPERFDTLDFGAFRVEEAWFTPDLTLDRHVHERTVFAIFLEGRMETRIRGRTLECGPSTVLTEPRGEPHTQRFGSSGAHLVVIQPHAEHAELFEACRGVFEEINHFAHGGIAAVARRIAMEFRRRDVVSPLAVEGLALEIVALAGRMDEKLRREPRPPAWLLRARDFVHDRFRESLRIGDVAEEVGVHPSYLARVFRQHYSVPMGSYVRRLRLDWAACRLQETGETLAVIAARAGFCDQSHFTHSFRQHFGMTPGSYRDSHR